MRPRTTSRRAGHATLAALVGGSTLVAVGLLPATMSATSAAGASPAVCTVTGTGAGAVLPDGGTATAVAVVDAGEAAPIIDLDVQLSATHAAVEELEVALAHGADTVTLADVEHPALQPPLADWANFTGTVWDDEAPLDKAYPNGVVTPPFTGPHRPTQALTAFDGDDAQGQWTLTVTEDLAGLAAGGSLDHWAVVVRYDCDLDKDGIANKLDNCPSAANTDQVDFEGDGRGDVCDPDDDNDGASDDVDNCSWLANDQADLDDDGFGDACDEDPDGDGFFIGDQCPRVYGFTDTGCPTVDRTLTATYVSKKKAFKGRLTADAPRCHKRRVVEMFRVARGRDPKVDQDRTNRRGVWRIDRDGKRRGRFYVRAAGETIPSTGYCAPARSNRVRLR